MPPPARRRRHAAGAVLLALAITAGCSSGPQPADSVGVAVRPFEEVQASPFEFEADPTNPHRGIFTVTTKEPMICAIVWGDTDALGRFNNSLSMNGTGITDHDVYLPDAIAGRTYYYVVQGTTADGTLYRSDLATFSIRPSAQPATPTSTPSQNLAPDATVSDVSSEFSDSYTATNAIDGDGTTEWSSAGDGNDAFITLELAQATPIGTVAFITRSMLDGNATTHTYTVTLDDDTILGPFPAGTPTDPKPSTIDDRRTDPALRHRHLHRRQRRRRRDPGLRPLRSHPGAKRRSSRHQAGDRLGQDLPRPATL